MTDYQSEVPHNEEACQQTYQRHQTSVDCYIMLSVFHQVSHCYRYDERPVCRHDIHICQGKSQYYMQQHIKKERHHTHPKEPFTDSCHYTQKQQ